MKESIKLLNEQADYMSHIFEEGKIGSVIYNSYALVHRVAADALQEINEKDATIKQLKKQLNAVNEELKDGPQPFMTADDWRDWLFSVLPFLEEGNKEKVTVTLHNHGYVKHELNFEKSEG